ncbi:MAG: hypothetical protein EA401_06860, partial [Planctomycetota bacterium]
MNRYGYVSVAVLLCALLVYILWPEAQDTAQPVWQGNPPQHYTLVLGELEQTVDHETVHLKG